jgi:hypothetical protein
MAQARGHPPSQLWGAVNADLSLALLNRAYLSIFKSCVAGLSGLGIFCRMAKTPANPLKPGPGKAAPPTPCVGTFPWRADDTGMSKTRANRPKIPRPDGATRQAAMQSRCVAAVPERPDAGGMKRPPANQTLKPKPSPRATASRADVQMVLARAKLIGAEAKRIRAIAQLIAALTGLLLAALHYVG